MSDMLKKAFIDGFGFGQNVDRGSDPELAWESSNVAMWAARDDTSLAWVLAQIRQIVGVNEKPMLSELPDAVRAAFDQQAATIAELRGLLQEVFEDDGKVGSLSWINRVAGILVKTAQKGQDDE